MSETNFTTLKGVAERIASGRSEVRKLAKALDDELTPLFREAGVEVACGSWGIKKVRGREASWWGIVSFATDDCWDEDESRFSSPKFLEDCKSDDIIAFITRGEGEALFTEYANALHIKVPEIVEAVTKVTKLLQAID